MHLHALLVTSHCKSKYFKPGLKFFLPISLTLTIVFLFSRRPLELDTDGIWCILPCSFPENFEVLCTMQSYQQLLLGVLMILVSVLVNDVVRRGMRSPSWRFKGHNVLGDHTVTQKVANSKRSIQGGNAPPFPLSPQILGGWPLLKSRQFGQYWQTKSFSICLSQFTENIEGVNETLLM